MTEKAQYDRLTYHRLSMTDAICRAQYIVNSIRHIILTGILNTTDSARHAQYGGLNKTVNL